MSLMSDIAPHVEAGCSKQHVSTERAIRTREHLEPFVHQVGGHSALSAALGRVWKPMILKELTFYQLIWSETFGPCGHWLRKWTPKFYGLFEGEKSAEPAPSNAGPLELTLLAKGKSKEVAQSIATVQASPWGKRLSQLRMKQKPMGLYTCLEDLTKRFKVPCIMDCKMGTRTYDDDASPEKKQRHIEKCRNTTSAKYGIRLSGMQVYRWQEQQYLFRDKYYGRRLRKEDLTASVAEFFDNGNGVRLDVVEQCIAKVQSLKDFVDTQKLFYFYSSSLLLVYDACEDGGSKVAVRMIDFAHTQQSFGRNDSGYALGITTLLETLYELRRNHSEEST